MTKLNQSEMVSSEQNENSDPKLIECLALLREWLWASEPRNIIEQDRVLRTLTFIRKMEENKK